MPHVYEKCKFAMCRQKQLQQEKQQKQHKQDTQLNQATTTGVASPTFRLRDCDITVAMVTVDDKEVKVQGHAASRCKADDRRSVNKQRQRHLV